jgi:hypothetical protein
MAIATYDFSDVTSSSLTISSIPSHRHNDLILESEKLIEYIDFAFKIMGIEISYSQFQKMNEFEKKSFLRDLKINKII